MMKKSMKIVAVLLFIGAILGGVVFYNHKSNEYLVFESSNTITQSDVQAVLKVLDSSKENIDVNNNKIDNINNN